MKVTGLGVTCLRGWQIALLPCALNTRISHQQLLRFPPAFETSSQLLPGAPAMGCTTQPQLRQHRNYPNATQSTWGKQGKTLGLAKPSPANTRAADKPVWSRKLVVLSRLRREKKQDAWSSPSIGMGTGGGEGDVPAASSRRPLAWQALFAVTSGDCSGGEPGRKWGCSRCGDSRGC